jgi:putative transposase
VNVYPFIEAEKAQQRNVKRACELLEVSRAASYAHRAGVPSARQLADEELTEHIRQAHQASKGRYGAPRIHAELRRRGHLHPRKRVARLMRAAGLCGRRPRRWKKTTVPDPAAAARADLIRRDFTVNAAAVNTRWCGDITYIPTWEGWLYLATVIDIASRRVVEPRPGRAAAHRTGRRRVGQRGRRPRSCIRGGVPCRPRLPVHQRRRRQARCGPDVTLSSGRTGQCWDNALAESFFASLNGECLDQQPWPTRAAACRATVECIAWYNGTRLHSALGYMTRRVRDHPPGGPQAGS